LILAADQKEAKMRGKLAIACFVLAVSRQVALADVVDECRGPGINIPACTEVITSPSFGADEKSLAYRYRGEARTDSGEVRLAIADFTESIRLRKDNMLAFAGRGRANFSDGDLAGSIADYSEAINHLPVPDAYPSVASDLHLQRGHVYTVRNQLDAAISDLTKAIRLNPLSAQALNDRGVAYLKKHDLDRAINNYTAAIVLSANPQIYANRGYAYEAQGRQDLAIADLKYALLHDPSMVGARDALKRLGEPVDAITNETNQRVHLGQELAEKNCSSCHAVGAADSSPDKNAVEFRNYYKKQPLFGLRAPITRAVRATHDQPSAMFVVLNDGELDAIVAYINSLSTAKRLGTPE